MKRYVKIRNALMHPKSVEDLKMSQDKIQTSDAAAEWFKVAFLSLLETCENDT